MNWIGDRLKERSTWVGLITLISLGGMAFTPEQKELIITVGTSVVALIFTFTKDK